jgi:hypothetical protein
MRDPSEHAKFVWNTMKRANSDPMYWKRIKLPDTEYARHNAAEQSTQPNRRTTTRAVENMLHEMKHDISGNCNKAQDAGHQRTVNKWKQYQNEVLGGGTCSPLGRSTPEAH